MNKYLLALLFFSVALFNACDKDPDNLTLIFKETKCDNPWGEAGLDDGSYYVVVRKYLSDYGIQVVGISTEVYDENAGTNCNTCDCLTGRNVVLVVPVRDAKKAEEVGFVLRQ
ncbi:MAG: hypothetical protein HQ522_04535 [Bacteroidetes bacterium]|nr:hypothetical protein [Bacteroidota bacterium]